MDDFEGQGGSYVVDENGKKTLVHRTKEAAPVERAPDADAAPKGKKTKPAADEVNHAKAIP